jgi:hypothetical protein
MTAIIRVIDLETTGLERWWPREIEKPFPDWKTP